MASPSLHGSCWCFFEYNGWLNPESKHTYGESVTKEKSVRVQAVICTTKQTHIECQWHKSDVITSKFICKRSPIMTLQPATMHVICSTNSLNADKLFAQVPHGGSIQTKCCFYIITGINTFQTLPLPYHPHHWWTIFENNYILHSSAILHMYGQADIPGLANLH